VRHDPRVIGKMAARIVPPRSRRIFSNLKVRASGGPAPQTPQIPPRLSSSSASTAAAPATPPSYPRSGIAAARKPVTCNMSISPEAKA